MIIICPSCAHQANIKRLKGVVKCGLVCSICRSHAYLRYLRFRGWMHDLRERERELAKLTTLAGLLWVAEQRGYKRGWAACKFRVIYHDWPQIEAVPEQPCFELSEWVKKQNQAYARDRRKLDAQIGKSANAQTSNLMSEADWQVDL